jgi:hypothetical protein
MYILDTTMWSARRSYFFRYKIFVESMDNSKFKGAAVGERRTRAIN